MVERKFFLLVLAALYVAPALHAQLSTASVNGTLRDSSGAVISGGAITLRNRATQVERTTTSNEAGNFVLLDVPPGNYTLEARQSGFAPARLEAFDLAVNQTLTIDLTLTVGTVEQSLTVQGVATQVENSTAELGAVITSKPVVDLPLNGRNFTQLLSLTPGTAPANVSQNAGSYAGNAGASASFPSVNGQTNRSNFFLLDGGYDQDAQASAYGVPPIIDAIQEFKVQSHNDEAEFGQALGGIINVVTKSGTNALHGSIWEYLRNDAFDARNRFLPSVTPFKQNQFGATAGGPVVIPKVYDGHNRTFFFLGYQGFRYRSPATNFYRVPTEANLAGDLSDWPRQIYNPFSTRPDPAQPGQFLRDPFPNNMIPASLINPGMVTYAKATLPSPIATSVPGDNALDSTPFHQNQDEYTARVDQALGQKDFVWFRWSGYILDSTGSGGRQALVSNNEEKAHNISASWNRTFNASTIIQAQFTRTYKSQNYLTSFRSLPSDFISQVGFSQSFASNFIGNRTLVPALNVDNFFSGGESVNFVTPSDVYQGKINFSKVISNHTIKAGFDYSTIGYTNYPLSASSAFTAFQTANPEDPGNTGSPLASFLLNVPDNASRRNSYATLEGGKVLGLYVQDQWKASSKLMVNFGLRYDRTFLPRLGTVSLGNIYVGNMDFNRGAYILQAVPPVCSSTVAAPCIPGGTLPDHVLVSSSGKVVNDSTRNFQPRLGLAYRLTDRTVIRSAFGIFFDNWAGAQQMAQNVQGTWPSVQQQLAQNLNNPSASQPTPNSPGTDPFQGGSVLTFPSATPFEQVQWFMDPQIKNPYSMQWNFGVEHQFGSSTSITANYVGSGSRRLDVGGFYNTAVTPGPGNPADRSPFAYITPTYYDRSWGTSSYNSLQFMLNKRFENGLAYMVSYTYSKSMDTACSGWYGVEGCSNQDPYNLKLDRSVSGFDLTHVFAVNWLYELPFGKGKLRTGSRVADYLLGNWQFNGIVQLHSGLPYTAGVSGDIANTGNSNCCSGFYERLNLVGDPAGKNDASEWLNPSAFAAPAPFTFGNLGRDVFRTDWYKNVDISLFRQFPIRERARIEFRAEAFNLLNVTTYAQPVNNFSNVSFGQVQSIASNPRQLQLALKILF